jgi:dolichyl-phosphate beta-glucosyltransferase
MSSTRPYLSIVIPAFNEAERIVPTLRDVAAWVAKEQLRAEVLVVDDGSSDATAKVVEALAAELPIVRLCARTPHRGKGHAVRIGMGHARGRLQLYMDADSSTPIHELALLLAHIADGADLAIGSRHTRGAKPPWYGRAWSKLGTAGLLEGIEDSQCGFKLFTAAAARRIFARVSIDGRGFELEVLVRARKLGYRIDEVAVTWQDDSRSKVHPVRDAIRMSLEYPRLRRAAQASASHPRMPAL